MKTVVLLLIIFSFNATAETFKISGNAFNFEVKDGVLVSGCEKNCEALKVFKRHKKIDLKKARQGVEFVGSTGSDVCKLIYKTNAVIGVNDDKDQRAFCVFKDNSMIEVNSLSDYLESKKIIQ